MTLYLAPLEGITGYVYRNAYHKYFGQMDKYFIPFINPNQFGHLSSKEKNNILPEHN
ncbi:MAG TPA: diguanylate cyclase, partial [Lachnospiraceae bacterium]|nr:diguanylate cyclase [Lachnospiraceae bacterium]